MHIIRLPIGLLASNCYLLYDRAGGEGIVVDPGMLDPRQLLQSITGLNLRVRYILNTHGHFDHIAGNGILMLPEIQRGIHPADRDLLSRGGGAAQFGLNIPTSPRPDLDLVDGMTLPLGASAVEIIHTPGHTPGCVCLYLPDEPAVLTGDTLFAGSVGRTDLPGGNHRTLEDSLRRLLQLPAATHLHPGHGPASSLAVEKQSNPWLKVLLNT